MQRASLYLWQRYTGNQEEVPQGNMSRKVREKLVGTRAGAITSHATNDVSNMNTETETLLHGCPLQFCHMQPQAAIHTRPHTMCMHLCRSFIACSVIHFGEFPISVHSVQIAKTRQPRMIAVGRGAL
jgi:hypothetical protein